MSEKRRNRHRMEHGKQAPQGHGEALDREQHGHGKAGHHAKERNDQHDGSGHTHHNRHADHRSENGHWYPYGELHHAEPGSHGFDLAQAAVEELQEAGVRDRARHHALA
jgi:hypothetical protein